MPDPAAADRKRVFLHVGTPKSGTTYLQRQLHANREVLREAGFLYPGERPGHFLQAMDLQEQGFHGHRYPGMEGAWDRVCAEAARFPGPALVSHEILGGIGDPMLERAATSFPGREVVVVVTCRDLGRQLPALWQEKVKNGATFSFDAFLDRVERGWDGTSAAGLFWASQNLARVGARWGDVVGAEHVVFVTMPPSGGASDVLWRRFAEAVDLSRVEVGLVASGSNASMGTAEVELLRRVNRQLPKDLSWPEHSQLIKKRFAQQRLAGRRSAGALTVPEGRRPAFEEISREMLDALATGGYRVVGDLAELRPVFGDGTTPDSVGDATVADAAVEQLVAMLLRGRKRAGRRGRHAPSAAPSLPRRAARRVARRLRIG